MSALTEGRLLARNTLFNLAGQAAPMLLAFFAIPLLIQGMGTARFGVLTLAWMVIGYLSIADLGVGRALTQILAEKLGAEQEKEIPALTWTALLLMLLLGLGGAVLLWLLTPWLVRHALSVPQSLQNEALYAFSLLALSLPFVISTAALRGILEAQQRFGLVNAVRVPMGIFTFLGPLAVLPFSSSLVPIVAVLVAGRVVAWLVHLVLCLRVVPALRDRVVVERSLMRPLLRFGSWMTVSNVVSPLMVFAGPVPDRRAAFRFRGRVLRDSVRDGHQAVAGFRSTHHGALSCIRYDLRAGPCPHGAAPGARAEGGFPGALSGDAGAGHAGS